MADGLSRAQQPMWHIICYLILSVLVAILEFTISSWVLLLEQLVATQQGTRFTVGFCEIEYRENMQQSECFASVQKRT